MWWLAMGIGSTPDCSKRSHSGLSQGLIYTRSSEIILLAAVLSRIPEPRWLIDVGCDRSPTVVGRLTYANRSRYKPIGGAPFSRMPARSIAG